MKQYKIERDGELEIGQIYYTKRFKLTVDRSLCKGCDLCRIVCPRNAIRVLSAEKTEGGKTLPPKIDIDEKLCDYHGICSIICPFNAIKITRNDGEELPVLTQDVFPKLTRDIAAQSEKCKPGCKKCAETCPIGIISVREESGKTAVDIDKDYCAGCQICWQECPENAIAVTKFYEGAISIEQESCPEGCHACLDVCPVNAMSLAEGGKVQVNNLFCIYCGACKNVCPNPEALSIERTAVRHTPVESGAWNRGLEKLTSVAGLNRELAAKRSSKVRASIKSLSRGEEV